MLNMFKSTTSFKQNFVFRNTFMAVKVINVNEQNVEFVCVRPKLYERGGLLCEFPKLSRERVRITELPSDQ